MCHSVAEVTPSLQKKNSGQSGAFSKETLRLLRSEYLYGPSDKPYNLNEPDNRNPSMGQAQVIDEILKGKVRIHCFLCVYFLSITFSLIISLTFYVIFNKLEKIFPELKPTQKGNL